MDLDDLKDLDERIQLLFSERAVGRARVAARLVREGYPEATLMLFWDAQEPGDTASLWCLLASDGSILFDTDEGIGDGDKLQLDKITYYLTGALEDDNGVFARGFKGCYVMPIPRA